MNNINCIILLKPSEDNLLITVYKILLFQGTLLNLMKAIDQGPVVQSPISANPGLAP